MSGNIILIRIAVFAIFVFLNIASAAFNSGSYGQSLPASHQNYVHVRAEGLRQCSIQFFQNFNAIFPHRPNMASIGRRNLIYKMYDHPQQIVQDADSVRIILHKDTLEIITAYSNNSAKGFIKRAITKRPYSFYHVTDKTVLRISSDGAIIPGPTNHQEWLANQNVHGEYLTYKEMLLSSLLMISSFTRFINDGRRKNRGLPGNHGSFHPRGVIVGVVGPRFVYLDQMDTKFMFVHANSGRPNSNSIESILCDYYFDNATPWLPYGQIARLSSNERNQRYREITLSSLNNPKLYPNQADRRIVRGYFDKFAYEKRLRLIIEPLLLDANKRAREAGTTAYVVITGFGLGYWAAFEEQKELFVENVFIIALGLWNSQLIPNISDLHFSHINEQNYFDLKAPSFMRLTKINVYHDNTDPTSSDINLNRNDKIKKLLVYAYAWDGNSFPGNEYWNDKIEDSGDSQAASCSAITELHNYQINPEFLEKVNAFSSKKAVQAFGGASQNVPTNYYYGDSDNEQDESQLSRITIRPSKLSTLSAGGGKVSGHNQRIKYLRRNENLDEQNLDARRNKRQRRNYEVDDSNELDVTVLADSTMRNLLNSMLAYSTDEKMTIKLIEEYGVQKINRPILRQIGSTLLHVAAYHDKATVVEWLILNGADPNVEDYDEHTPLQVAVMKGSTKSIYCLKKFTNQFANI